jgi:hypothetical protein
MRRLSKSSSMPCPFDLHPFAVQQFGCGRLMISLFSGFLRHFMLRAFPCFSVSSFVIRISGFLPRGLALFLCGLL